MPYAVPTNKRTMPRAKRPSNSAEGRGYRWQKQSKNYLMRNPVCVQCERPATQVDHIVPLRQGGTHKESNLQALCASCHSSKTARERTRNNG